jgi:hypothetical protein
MPPLTTTEIKYPHIEKLPDRPARFEAHPRMSISWFVPAFRSFGSSVEEMCRQYPFLKPAEIHAAMAYYHDHAEEVDREIAENERLAEEARQRTPPSPFVQRMRAEGRL